jgi:hypothetical protein
VISRKDLKKNKRMSDFGFEEFIKSMPDFSLHQLLEQTPIQGINTKKQLNAWVLTFIQLLPYYISFLSSGF